MSHGKGLKVNLYKYKLWDEIKCSPIEFPLYIPSTRKQRWSQASLPVRRALVNISATTEKVLVLLLPTSTGDATQGRADIGVAEQSHAAEGSPSSPFVSVL